MKFLDTSVNWFHKRFINPENLEFSSNQEYMTWVEKSDEEWNRQYLGHLVPSSGTYTECVDVYNPHLLDWENKEVKYTSPRRCTYCGILIFEKDRYCVACGAPS